MLLPFSCLRKFEGKRKSSTTVFAWPESIRLIEGFALKEALSLHSQIIDLRSTAEHSRMECPVFDFAILELRVRDLPFESLLAGLGASVECRQQITSRHLLGLHYSTRSS